MMFTPGACCGCSSGSTTCVVVTAQYCTPSRTLPAGYTVNAVATSGGALLDSQTTDATGKVTLCVPTGTAWQIVVEGGPDLGTQTFTGSAVTPRTVSLTTPSGYCCLGTGVEACCPGGLLLTKRSITLTDANGTWGPADVCGVIGGSGSFFCTGPSPSMSVWNGTNCVVDSGTFPYRYDVIRTSTGWKVIRTWTATTGLPCIPAEATCGSPSPTSSGTFTNAVDCPEIYISGTLSADGTCPDPVGGSVTIST